MSIPGAYHSMPSAGSPVPSSVDDPEGNWKARLRDIHICRSPLSLGSAPVLASYLQNGNTVVKDFKYDCKPKSWGLGVPGRTCVLQKFKGPNGWEDLVRYELLEDEHWGTWFQTTGQRVLPQGIETEGLLPPPRPLDDLPTGVCILLSPCAEGDLFEGELFDIPFKQQYWDKVTKSFRLPGCDSSAWLDPTEETQLSLSQQPELARLTSRSRSQGGNPRSFAMLATYVHSRKLTLAVLLGCDQTYVDGVTKLLENASDEMEDPRFMVGICAELHFFTVRDLAEDRINQCARATFDLEELIGNRQSDMRNKGSDSRMSTRMTNLIATVLRCRRETLEVHDELEATRTRIEKAIDSPVFSNLGAGPMDIASRYLQRFDYIVTRLQTMKERAQFHVEQMSFSADIIRSEYSGQEARNSAIIAFVAMLYLPFTALATILATPVFNFENEWRDFRGRVVNDTSTATSLLTATATSTGTASTGEVSPDESLPIFSVWGWILLGLGAVLVYVTVETWWWVTRISRYNHSIHDFSFLIYAMKRYIVPIFSHIFKSMLEALEILAEGIVKVAKPFWLVILGIWYVTWMGIEGIGIMVWSGVKRICSFVSKTFWKNGWWKRLKPRVIVGNVFNSSGSLKSNKSSVPIGGSPV